MSETDEDVVEIASYPYLHVAELAASVLEGSGIECFLGDAYVAGLRPDIIFMTGGVKLFVKASDAERARDALTGLELPADGPVARDEETDD